MNKLITKLILTALPIADVILCPFVYPAAWLMKGIRTAGVHRLPWCKSALMRVGVFPIRRHYYEPSFDNRTPVTDFSENRHLPSINWNTDGQLAFLNRLRFSDELGELPQHDSGALEFSFNNGAFESGDAEYWYQVIRAVKPRRIIEIGSGKSTLMAIRAIKKNREEDNAYKPDHVCIEPYEAPWLEQLPVSVVRKKVEELDASFFKQLQENDLLFIDSSHVIRPQGDVLFEYLEVLPVLNRGVIVHIHDIFSPRNYLRQWLQDEVKLWNEQYLLEAFLSNNGCWEIIGALNYLHHNHYDKLKRVAPFLTPTREPGSFYIRKLA